MVFWQEDIFHQILKTNPQNGAKIRKKEETEPEKSKKDGRRT